MDYFDFHLYSYQRNYKFVEKQIRNTITINKARYWLLSSLQLNYGKPRPNILRNREASIFDGCCCNRSEHWNCPRGQDQASKFHQVWFVFLHRSVQIIHQYFNHTFLLFLILKPSSNDVHYRFTGVIFAHTIRPSFMKSTMDLEGPVCWSCPKSETGVIIICLFAIFPFWNS